MYAKSNYEMSRKVYVVQIRLNMNTKILLWKWYLKMSVDRYNVPGNRLYIAKSVHSHSVNLNVTKMYIYRSNICCLLITKYCWFTFLSCMNLLKYNNKITLSITLCFCISTCTLVISTKPVQLFADDILSGKVVPIGESKAIFSISFFFFLFQSFF